MRHALRRLLKNPAFSLTALITIGAAIGANALIFSVVNGVVLKPLPFADPDRLVGVWHVAPGLGMPGPMNQGPTTYFTYRDNKVFNDIGMWDNFTVTITGRGEPERVDGLLVTDGTTGGQSDSEKDAPNAPGVSIPFDGGVARTCHSLRPPRPYGVDDFAAPVCR
jgi:hypothetical protein